MARRSDPPIKLERTKGQAFPWHDLLLALSQSDDDCTFPLAANLMLGRIGAARELVAAYVISEPTATAWSAWHICPAIPRRQRSNCLNCDAPATLGPLIRAIRFPPPRIAAVSEAGRGVVKSIP